MQDDLSGVNAQVQVNRERIDSLRELLDLQVAGYQRRLDELTEEYKRLSSLRIVTAKELEAYKLERRREHGVDVGEITARAEEDRSRLFRAEAHIEEYGNTYKADRDAERTRMQTYNARMIAALGAFVTIVVVVVNIVIGL